MKVKQINWTDKSALEATVVVTDGIFDIEAFCSPCTLSIGMKMLSPLQSLSESNIVKIEPSVPKVLKNNEWSYEIVAQVKNVGKRLVTVGGIEISLGPIPGDLKNGDTIRFCSSRIDVLD